MPDRLFAGRFGIDRRQGEGNFDELLAVGGCHFFEPFRAFFGLDNFFFSGTRVPACDWAN